MILEGLCKNCFNEIGDAKACPICGYDGTSLDNTDVLQPGTILNGKYIVGKMLGQGGFGITYYAIDMNGAMKYAIKEYYPYGMCSRDTKSSKIDVLTGETNSNYKYGLQRFIVEAKALATFSKVKEIVNVISYFEENNTAYFVMEYIEGVTLRKFLDKEPEHKISWERARGIILPVMVALEALHSREMIHRDIAPDNIIITSNNNVKLLDFGNARYSVTERSLSLTVAFKAGYTPIEQYSTKGVQGPWTDIYALSATLYVCLTGTKPDAPLDRLTHDTLQPPILLNSNIPKCVSEAIMKALSIDQGKRHQSIGEFRNQLLKSDQKEAEKTRKINARKTRQYQAAVACLKKGQYFFAIRLFSQLGDYTDSLSMLQTARYEKQKKKEKRRERLTEAYTNVIKALKSLRQQWQKRQQKIKTRASSKPLLSHKSIKDEDAISPKQVYRAGKKKIRPERKTELFQTAMACFNKGWYSFAIWLFNELGDYKDSLSMVEKARYEKQNKKEKDTISSKQAARHEKRKIRPEWIVIILLIVVVLGIGIGFLTGRYSISKIEASFITLLAQISSQDVSIINSIDEMDDTEGFRTEAKLLNLEEPDLIVRNQESLSISLSYEQQDSVFYEELKQFFIDNGYNESYSYNNPDDFYISTTFAKDGANNTYVNYSAYGSEMYNVGITFECDCNDSAVMSAINESILAGSTSLFFNSEYDLMDFIGSEIINEIPYAYDDITWNYSPAHYYLDFLHKDRNWLIATKNKLTENGYTRDTSIHFSGETVYYKNEERGYSILLSRPDESDEYTLELYNKAFNYCGTVSYGEGNDLETFSGSDKVLNEAGLGLKTWDDFISLYDGKMPNYFEGLTIYQDYIINDCDAGTVWMARAVLFNSTREKYEEFCTMTTNADYRLEEEYIDDGIIHRYYIDENSNALNIAFFKEQADKITISYFIDYNVVGKQSSANDSMGTTAEARGAPEDTSNSKLTVRNKDYIKIVDVSPTEVTVGSNQKFTVRIEYELYSIDEATIAIAFNTDEPDCYLHEDNIVVRKGVGEHTFSCNVNVVDWGSSGKFEILVPMDRYPIVAGSSCLATDFYTLKIVD